MWRPHVLALLQAVFAEPSSAAEQEARAMRLPACDPVNDCEPRPDRGEKCAAVTGGPPPGNGRFSCLFTVTVRLNAFPPGCTPPVTNPN